MLAVAGSRRVQHPGTLQQVDTVSSRDPSTPTSSTAYGGLRNDVMHMHNPHYHIHHHYRNRRKHHQPPPARRRSSPLPPVQVAADPPTPRDGVAQASTVSSAWESGHSEYRTSPKVITIVDGTGVPRPRPNVKFLLNRQSAQTYEQFVRDVAYALSNGTFIHS